MKVAGLPWGSYLCMPSTGVRAQGQAQGIPGWNCSSSAFRIGQAKMLSYGRSAMLILCLLMLPLLPCSSLAGGSPAWVPHGGMSSLWGRLHGLNAPEVAEIGQRPLLLPDIRGQE